MRPESRPKPHQIVVVVGVLIFLLVVASGLAPAITGWEEDSPTHRAVFGNVPTALKVAFYATVATMLFVVAVLTAMRTRNYERGQPDDRRTTRANAHRRLADFRAGVWMRTLLRDPVAVSPVAELVRGRFHEVIDDGVDAGPVRRVVLCSGKV